MDVALLASKCKHPGIRLVSTSADFECDVCGLQANSTFLVFREQALSCDDCGLLVHEKCVNEPFTPATRLYAFTRRRERKAGLIWRTTLLPELKAKHIALEQKAKALQETFKRLRAKCEEAHWNRSWAIRTFASKFYSEFNPEKAEPGNLNQLVAYYAKSPARCRQFFERLAVSYPEHKVRIIVECKNMEEVLRKDETELNELDAVEATASSYDSLKDELQREISFPMNPAMGVAPRWRLRLSVDGTTIVMGDFFLEHLRARLRISAGVPEGNESGSSCFVKVDIVGLEANKKAVFSASLSRFGMSGPSLPMSYSADNLSLSFECAFKLRADYQHSTDAKKKGVWKVSSEGTSCVISNLRHAVEGSSIPIPSKVIDFALDSLLTYGLKKAVLAVLPGELGEYILRFGKQVCNMEWRVKLESLVSRDDIRKTPLDKVVFPDRVVGSKWKREGPCQLLARVMRRVTPRPKAVDEVWTLAKVTELYRRYIRESIEREHWMSIWNEAIRAGKGDDGGDDQSPTAEDLFAFIEKVDSKPCSIEVDCIACDLFLAVRSLSRVVRGVLLRAVSSKSTTSVELREGSMMTSRKSSASIQTQQESTRATAQQARAAIYEVCASFEQAVESALSHAVRRLGFGLELVIAGGLLSFNVSRFKMISKLGEEFEAPIPAKWIGDRLLQSGKENYPWKNTFAVEPNSGALKFVFVRSTDPPAAAQPTVPEQDQEQVSAASSSSPLTGRSFGDLIVQLAELEVRVAFDGLVEELLRQQRRSLFGAGGGAATEEAQDALFAHLGASGPPTTPSAMRTMPPALRGSNATTAVSTPEPSLVSSPERRVSPMLPTRDGSSTLKGDDGLPDGPNETFIMMRVGFKGNVGAVAKGLGNPRLETSLQHLLIHGPFDSLLRLSREFRLGKSADESKAEVDEVDALLEKIETKVSSGGPDQKLLSSLLLEMDATATADSDLHVNVALPMNDPRPAFVFMDDVDLVTFVSEIIQIVT